uniref:Heat shock protein 70 n=1 Tax=Panagrolaimus davidi TaxID=227884 RepID=A0A914QY36_9BILA
MIPERGSKEKVELPPQRNNLYFYIDENEISSVGSEETLHQVQNHGNSINMNDQLKQSAEKKNLERQRHEPIKNRILSKEDNQATSHFQPKIEAKCSNICYNFPQKATAKSEKIGIDLGTTRCCVAVNRNGVIITIPLDSTGERLLPSYISYDEEMVKCGKVVVGRLQYHSNSTIFDSKRIIGRTFNDVKIEENWDFNVICDNEAVLLETYGFNGKTKFTAVEAAADLLKYIKKRAEEFEGKQITKAVITVPAAFSDSQKVATESAAKEAGWKEVQLLPEPIAAAFAYFIERPISNNSIVLLFDLGGGTLDVCIFKVENDSMKIISNTGDTQIAFGHSQ